MATIFDNSNIDLDGVIFTDPAVSGPITVTTEGIIANFGGDALDLSGGDYNVQINGLLHANSTALDLNSGTISHKVTIGVTGTVFGGIAGISVQDTASILNKGHIIGANQGIYIDAERATIVNYGEISSYTGTAINTNVAAAVTLKNFSLVSGKILGGIGNDVVQNVASILGDIDLGDGKNIIVNANLIDGNVAAGSGTDYFKNTGNVNGSILLGSGNDTYIGGKQGVLISDQDGADTYLLGFGLDAYTATTAGDAANDIVNGGAGSGKNLTGGIGDVYDASMSANAVIINMSSATQTDIFVLGPPAYGKNTATGIDIGTDSVKNFETILGGAGADVIFGHTGANDIRGGDNDDHLFGLEGNDFISGESGKDLIVGGRGADQLNGNASILGDGVTDTFVYVKLTDSTNALAGRDTIHVFEDGIDLIDFSRLTLAGVATVAATMNAAFAATGNAEVRVLTAGSGYVVQLDADGNGTSDLAINIAPNGPMTWDASDFLF